MKTKLLSLIILSFLAVSTSFSQEINYESFGIDSKSGLIPDGLKEGDKAPGFTGYDQTGKMTTLDDLLKKGPVVLFFYRGNWCPACNKQLSSYQDSVKFITDQGFTLVAITPESIEFVEQTVKLHNLTFPVIYDCQEKIMQDYKGMFNVTKDFQDLVQDKLKVNIAEHNGRDVAHLPVTATYVINRNGIITAAHFNPDYHIRASVKWIIRNLGSAL
jgi:peroxiredoxin